MQVGDVTDRAEFWPGRYHGPAIVNRGPGWEVAVSRGESQSLIVYESPCRYGVHYRMSCHYSIKSDIACGQEER